MKKPYVSVIVAIYNMERYLTECLETIKNQSFRNIEIIMVDDGSTDSSNDICRRYVIEDNRFKLYSKENGGVASAWNTGLSLAKGKWIMFVDPDDKVDINIIKRLLEEAEKETDIVCCCCKVLLENSLDRDHFFDRNRSFTTIFEKQALIGQLLDHKYEHPDPKYTAIGVVWGKLYRTRLLKENSILFDTTLRRIQDSIFNTYAFVNARRVKYLNETLYTYRLGHISRFLSDYKEQLLSIYSNLQISRERSFLELELFRYTFFREKYFENAIYNMIIICKYGIFRKGVSYQKQKKEFEYFINLPFFQRALRGYKKEVSKVRYLCNHPIRFMYFQFIYGRCVFLLHLWGEYSNLFGR